MKYALLTYSKRPMRNNGVIRLNIGDPIQTYAMKYIYSLMGVREEELVEVSRYHSKSYNGDYVILPYNCFNRIYNQSGYEYNSLPLSNKIIPVFLSFHLHSRVIDERILSNLKQYQPIGCRDEETMINMRNHDITAYVSGCVTAVLPRRMTKPQNGKVFFVDIPDNLMKYIPDKLIENGEFINHHVVFERSSNEEYMVEEEYQKFYNLGISQLMKYKEEAKLVVTSRLHAASPCMAMGIPVILVNDSFDGRFSWIGKYLPLYTKETYEQIDWYPNMVDYEHIKKNIIQVFMQQIKDSYDKYVGIYNISSFYELRADIIYNSELKNAIKKLPFSDAKNIHYGIWGLTTLAETLKNIIEDNCNSWKFVNAVDKICNGTFEGCKVIMPSEIQSQNEEIIYFIIPESAHKEATEILTSIKRSFVLVSKRNMEYIETK